MHEPPARRTAACRTAGGCHVARCTSHAGSCSATWLGRTVQRRHAANLQRRRRAPRLADHAQPPWYAALLRYAAAHVATANVRACIGVPPKSVSMSPTTRFVLCNAASDYSMAGSEAAGAADARARARRHGHRRRRARAHRRVDTNLHVAQVPRGQVAHSAEPPHPCRVSDPPRARLLQQGCACVLLHVVHAVAMRVCGVRRVLTLHGACR